MFDDETTDPVETPAEVSDAADETPAIEEDEAPVEGTEAVEA
jgi:hypothetical protein